MCKRPVVGERVSILSNKAHVVVGLNYSGGVWRNNQRLG